MRYATKFAEAVALMREWANEEVANGRPPAAVHLELMRTREAVLNEFRIKHEVPGVRYWHIPETNAYFTTSPGERMPEMRFPPMQLARHEFLSRQGVHFEDDETL
jgi:hypothetical protein